MIARRRGDAPPAAVTRSKYGVRMDAAGKAARTIDGIVFHSRREAKRWAELKLLEKAGLIRDLARQMPFPILAQRPDGTRVAVGTYVCDFVYMQDGQRVIEDAKGVATESYRLKKKLVEAQYGIRITEV